MMMATAMAMILVMIMVMTSKTKFAQTVISRYTDTWCKDILGVRTMQLGTKHCILTTVVLLSKRRFDVRNIFLVTNAVVTSRNYCTSTTEWAIWWRWLCPGIVGRPGLFLFLLFLCSFPLLTSICLLHSRSPILYHMVNIHFHSFILNVCWTGSAGPARYILEQSAVSNQFGPVLS